MVLFAGYMMPDEDSDLLLNRSLTMDVKGQPRTQPVRVPNYLYSGRPGAMPNEKVQNVVCITDLYLIYT